MRDVRRRSHYDAVSHSCQTEEGNSWRNSARRNRWLRSAPVLPPGRRKAQVSTPKGAIRLQHCSIRAERWLAQTGDDIAVVRNEPCVVLIHLATLGDVRSAPSTGISPVR